MFVCGRGVSEDCRQKKYKTKTYQEEVVNSIFRYVPKNDLGRRLKAAVADAAKLIEISGLLFITGRILHQENHKKCVDAVFALRPYFSFMTIYNGFGNREPKAEAARPGSCLIGPVEPLEQMIQIFCGYRFPFIGYFQYTVPFATSL